MKKTQYLLVKLQKNIFIISVIWCVYQFNFKKLFNNINNLISQRTDGVRYNKKGDFQLQRNVIPFNSQF